MSTRRKSSATTWTPRLEVLVRRDGFSGHVYSAVIDAAAPPLGARDGTTTEVVIDRQRGRQLDAETVRRRAQALSELLGLPYREELEWPCIAALGHNSCRCPRCVKQETSR